MNFEAAYSKRFRTGNFLRQRELNLLHYSQVFMYHDLLWAKPESRFGKNHSSSLACWSSNDFIKIFSNLSVHLCLKL